LQVLNNSITEYIQINNINCSVNSVKFNKDEKVEVDNSDISPGKYLIIQRIIELSNYSMDDLKDKTLRELMLIYKDLIVKNNGNGNGNDSQNQNVGGNENVGGSDNFGGNDNVGGKK